MSFYPPDEPAEKPNPELGHTENCIVRRTGGSTGELVIVVCDEGCPHSTWILEREEDG